MTPFYFGRPERGLFGMIHPPANGGEASSAVLLCNPYGQEAVRAHRVFRVLAERLTREGFAVMRFDYHATGDSPGEDEEGDLSGWVGDVRAALRELVTRTGARRVVCIGARLGCVMAIRAASGLAELVRIVLWDPIVEGEAYLAELRVKHVQALESSYSLPDPQWRRQLKDETSAFTNEVIGFGMAPTLREQIRALGAHNLPLPPGVPVHVMAAKADTSAAAWATTLAARGADCQFWPLDESFDWPTGERRNSAIVPAPALARLLASVA